jgi:hypothetical protein
VQYRGRPEEELDSGAQPASWGRDKRMRVAGRNRHGFSLRDFWAAKTRDGG